MLRTARRSRVDRRIMISLFLVITVIAAILAPAGFRPAAAQEIQTRVQVLHAAPGLGKIEVHINNQEVLDEFEYGDLSDWIDLQPGSDRLTITQDRAGFNYAVFDAMYPVPAGNDYYVIISDDIVMTSVVDRSPVADGAARVRVSQSSVDLPEVNVSATNGNVTFATQLTYPRTSDYVSVPAGTYDIEVKLADTGESVFTAPGITLEGNQVYDLVIMGKPNNDDKPLKIQSLVDTTTEKTGTPSS